MRPKRLAPAVIAALCLAAAAACNDTVAPSRPGSRPAAPTTPAVAIVTGFIHATGTRSAPIVLTTADGEEIALVGSSAAALDRVDGAEVEVRGSWNEDQTLAVFDFLVRSVNGAPVMDGVLISADFVDEAYTSAATTYAILLTRGGTIALSDPPAELIAHVGERVWVAAADDNHPTAFGIIGE